MGMVRASIPGNVGVSPRQQRSKSAVLPDYRDTIGKDSA